MVNREAKSKGVRDREGGKGMPDAKWKRVGKEKKVELEIQRNLEGQEEGRLQKRKGIWSVVERETGK